MIHLSSRDTRQARLTCCATSRGKETRVLNRRFNFNTDVLLLLRVIKLIAVKCIFSFSFGSPLIAFNLVKLDVYNSNHPRRGMEETGFVFA